MKKIVFSFVLVINVAALYCSIKWALSKPGYEAFTSIFAILASISSLFLSRDFWFSGEGRTTVMQTKNRVSGDMAGRDIIKQ